MVPSRWESPLLPSISLLLRTCLLLTVAWCLAATMSVANAEVPVEPAWPDVPHFSAELSSPHFLLIKQEKAGSTRYPLVVRDLRTWSTPDGTRLVLDLNHKASFTESYLRNPDRVVIEVSNAILGKSSRQRVSGGTIPQSFHIAQSRPRIVTITLPRTQGLKYKAFALTNPDRLVIDLYGRIPERPSGGATPATARNATVTGTAPMWRQVSKYRARGPTCRAWCRWRARIRMGTRSIPTINICWVWSR